MIELDFRFLVPLHLSRLPDIAAASARCRLSLRKKGKQTQWKETYGYDDDPSRISRSARKLAALRTGDLRHQIFLSSEMK